jgi:hypothetical protein
LRLAGLPQHAGNAFGKQSLLHAGHAAVPLVLMLMH